MRHCELPNQNGQLHPIFKHLMPSGGYLFSRRNKVFALQKPHSSHCIALTTCAGASIGILPKWADFMPLGTEWSSDPHSILTSWQRTARIAREEYERLGDKAAIEHFGNVEIFDHDSYVCGNCSPGTRLYTRTHFPLQKTTVSDFLSGPELLWYEDRRRCVSWAIACHIFEQDQQRKS